MTITTPQKRPAAGPAASSSILKMAAPLVVSFWMRSLFTFVDTAYAAYLGDAAVAAIGFSIPLEFLLIACWVGVSTGLTSCLSRAMGAREGTRIEQLLATTRRIMWGLMPAFALLAVVLFLGAGYLGLDADTAHLFAVYVGVLIGGSAFTSFWSIIPDSIVKAHHDTRSTMWAGIWSNLINVVLNTVFTFVFGWGVFGIALSTVLGRFGGLVYALRRAAAHEAARKASNLDTVPTLDPAPFRSIMALAIPAALTYALMAMETSLVNWLLTGQSNATSAIAAYGIYYRVMLFAVMPIIAASVAILPFVARLFGAGDLAAVRRGLRQIVLASIGYCVVVVTPALALTAPALARVLAESQVTADLTRVALWLCPLACLSLVPLQLLRPAFEGLQRGWPGLIMAVLRYVIFAPPAAFFGREVAIRVGAPVIHGIVVGLICASTLASLIFFVWLQRVLTRLELRSSSGPDRVPAL
jgi:Na+-driven multidrug efflux pump